MKKTFITSIGILALCAAQSFAAIDFTVSELDANIGSPGPGANNFETSDGSLTTAGMQAQVGTFAGGFDIAANFTDWAQMTANWRPFGTAGNPAVFDLGYNEFPFPGAQSTGISDQFADGESNAADGSGSLVGETIYIWAFDGAVPGDAATYANGETFVAKAPFDGVFPTGDEGTPGQNAFTFQIDSLAPSDIIVGTLDGQGDRRMVAIPEPASMTLIFGALGSLLFFRRRRG